MKQKDNKYQCLVLYFKKKNRTFILLWWDESNLNYLINFILN
jgi:hypothetical protein